MKFHVYCSAILVFILSASPCMAQMTTPHGPRGDENITGSGGPGTGEGKRTANTMPEGDYASGKPPLRLTPQEREAVAAAMTKEHTYQAMPKGFEPQIGAAVTEEIKLNPMPRPLVYEIPVLLQYSYAKLEREVLVIDPMSMKVVDVIPRKLPIAGKPIDPLTWWATRGRALIGLPPQQPETTAQSSAAAER